MVEGGNCYGKEKGEQGREGFRRGKQAVTVNRTIRQNSLENVRVEQNLTKSAIQTSWVRPSDRNLPGRGTALQIHELKILNMF